MIINCFYDEDMEYADIIYIPDLGVCVNDVQALFFDWLFDKNNNHRYWIVVEGEKKACKYGIEAFVEWLNNYYLLDNGKAYIINKNAKRWDTDNIRLIF